MRIIARPIETWPGEMTRDSDRDYAPFSASWHQTLDLLAAEAGNLGATEVVMQLAIGESDLRIDGLVRANASPTHPGVIVSFESRYSPLRYSTDRFKRGGLRDHCPGWQANVRAVALGLEALRKVDRYGISTGGEQYSGFKAIGAAEPSSSSMSVEWAASLLARHAWPEVAVDTTVGLALMDPASAFRAAAKTMHPDVGGDPEEYRRLVEARDLVIAHA
jgi:hypothetical protein